MMEMPNKNDTIERLIDIRDRAVVSDGMFTERATYMVKLIDDAITLLKEQEPRVLTLDKIQEGGGYWLCVSGDLVSRPVICVYKEMDAQKPYITFAWQFGTFSWDTEEYGTGWRCWSSRPTDEQRRETPWTE